MDAILSKSNPKPEPTIQRIPEIGRVAPITRIVPSQDRKILMKSKVPDTEKPINEVIENDRMSNYSKVSQSSAALSITNRRLAVNRKINPILRPLNQQTADPNTSKHSFSANHSVMSEQDTDEVTLDEIEQLLSTTQTKMSELTKEFKTITSTIVTQPVVASLPKPAPLPKPDSGKGVRPTATLDSLLTSTALNLAQRTGSKVGFSIKTSGRQQRSLSKPKK